MTDRYAFISTATRGDEVVALIGDKEKIGAAGIEDARNLMRARKRAEKDGASVAFNSSANGVLRNVSTMTADGIKQLKEHIEASGQQMPESIAQLDRALQCISTAIGVRQQTQAAPQKIGMKA